jgi:hypothetical protein
MASIMRGLRILVAVAMASVAGGIPACGTMGGGGMKYFAEPTVVAQAPGEARPSAL